MSGTEQTPTPSPEHFRVRVYDNSRNAAYFELPEYPQDMSTGCVGRTVAIHQLLGPDYIGPALNLDFDHNDRPIGIEVLYPYAEDDRE